MTTVIAYHVLHSHRPFQQVTLALTAEGGTRTVEDCPRDRSAPSGYAAQHVTSTSTLDAAASRHLLALVDDLRAAGIGSGSGGMDGEIHTLTIGRGQTSMELSWWGRPPQAWTGASALVDALQALINSPR